MSIRVVRGMRRSSLSCARAVILNVLGVTVAVFLYLEHFVCLISFP